MLAGGGRLHTQYEVKYKMHRHRDAYLGLVLVVSCREWLWSPAKLIKR